MTRSIPVSAADTERIEGLTPLARLARRQHMPDDPKVLASQELTRLFKDLNSQGHSVSMIAKASGMTYHSVSARIKSDA